MNDFTIGPKGILLMGEAKILKWGYLMIFMWVLVAVSVSWCKV